MARLKIPFRFKNLGCKGFARTVWTVSPIPGWRVPHSYSGGGGAVASFSILIAEDEPAAQTPNAGPLGMLIPLLIMGVFLYFMAIRPMKKQEKERKLLIQALKKNDRVLTTGGIIGVIANVRDKDDEILLKVDENSNVRLRVARSSIVRVLSDKEPAKEPIEEKS
jgi:preprotein translocase subunit YajC